MFQAAGTARGASGLISPPPSSPPEKHRTRKTRHGYDPNGGGFEGATAWRSVATEREVSVEKHGQSIEHGLLLDPVCVIGREAGSRREDAGHRRRSRLTRWLQDLRALLHQGARPELPILDEPANAEHLLRVECTQPNSANRIFFSTHASCSGISESRYSFAARSRCARLVRTDSVEGRVRGTNRSTFDSTRRPRVAWLSHAPGKIRTCDLCLRRAALYPLSYGRPGRPV